MASSRLRSLPSARRICSPSPLPATAMPAESYPRYSSRFSPSMMTGTTRLLPTYPTIPHIGLVYEHKVFDSPKLNLAAQFKGREGRANNAPMIALILDGITIFFDDRVGKHVARDALNFRLRLCLIQPAVQLDLEILSLAQIGDAL